MVGPTDMQHEDPVSTQLDGVAQRNAVHQATAGGSSPGTAADAMTASTIEPRSNQCSAESSIPAAQHMKRTGRSSIRRSPTTAVSARRSGVDGCAATRLRASSRNRPMVPAANTALASSDGRAEHEIGTHSGLDQRAQHADLDSAQHTTTTENDRGATHQSHAASRRRSTPDKAAAITKR